jgi:hypothetical protein
MSLTECGVSECDLEASTIWRPRLVLGFYSPTLEGDIVMFLPVTIKYQNTVNFMHIGYIKKGVILAKLPDHSRPQFHLSLLGALALMGTWRHMAAKVGTSKGRGK